MSTATSSQRWPTSSDGMQVRAGARRHPPAIGAADRRSRLASLTFDPGSRLPSRECPADADPGTGSARGVDAVDVFSCTVPRCCISCQEIVRSCSTRRLSTMRWHAIALPKWANRSCSSPATPPARARGRRSSLSVLDSRMLHSVGLTKEVSDPGTQRPRAAQPHRATDALNRRSSGATIRASVPDQIRSQRHDVRLDRAIFAPAVGAMATRPR